ncbi:MAG: hypothetical protein KGH89_08865 [Thaumarchaeota archaeon]|nr:hypothetical protein [Nitrososphaerota archaeon]MDE1866945.1 hypothetical protein [Nitrososphaerota archaeon]
MNQSQKLAIILPGIFAMCAVLSISFLSHSYATAQTPSDPQCETTYTVIYSNPEKFDEAKTINSLKQNLSNIDFSGDILGSHPWWSYIHISKPDANSVSELTIPTASGQADSIVTKTMQGIDGISKVDSMITAWCN